MNSTQTTRDIAGRFLVTQERQRKANSLVSCWCGWQGKETNLVSDYLPDGDDDVVPVSVCPKCKSELIQPLNIAS